MVFARCSLVHRFAGSVFGPEADNGFIVREDGTWAQLGSGGDPSPDLDMRGTSMSMDTTDFNGPGSYQLDLTLLSGGTVVTMPTLFDGGSQILLNSNGVFEGRYVKRTRSGWTW